jgi:hypothetical protein
MDLVKRVGMLALIAALMACEPAPPEFKIELQHKDDTIRVKATADETTFIITSQTGIGRAKIGPREGAWPKRVRLDLRLKTLEGFSVGNGKLKLATFLGADGPAEAFLRDEEGTYRPAPDYKAPAITVLKKRRGIEVVLPAEIFENAESIDVQWIDAYRN